MLATIALATLLSSASPTQSNTMLRAIVLEGPSQIAIDGRHYALPAGTLEVHIDGYRMNAAPTMTNCARPNGAPQVVTANTLRWAGGQNALYLAPGTETPPVEMKFAEGMWIVTVQSASGDVSCTGEVMPPGVLFRGGFE